MPVTTRFARVRTVCVTAIAFAGGCSSPVDPVITSALECDHCLANERDTTALRRLGDDAVGPLTHALRGPTADQLENLRYQFSAQSARIAATGSDSALYVNRLLSNARAQYQKRAAQALAVIATPGAVAALQLALSDQASGRVAYRADVLPVIHRAIADATGVVTWKLVSAGLHHTCGVLASGDTYCWGLNLSGQLGQYAPGPPALAPVRVVAGYRADSVEAGQLHTCGMLYGREAFCWGLNSSGQLGDGSRDDKPRPGRVAGTRRWVSLSAGGQHSCGVAAASGGTWCWGWNRRGQLGDGTGVDSDSAVRVQGPLVFRSVSTGSNHTCADSVIGGTAFCWGDNGNGQLGDGSIDSRSAPVSVLVSSGAALTVSALSAGQTHSCALSPNGDALCWGSNGAGQLGIGASGDRNRATLVSGGITFSGISAGGYHTCAVTGTGAAYCWGRNQEGQLGDGTTTDRPVPTAVVGGHVFAVVSAGVNHTCGVTRMGEAFCWGLGGGRLGTGSPANSSEPRPVAKPQ
ncbi:MAG TPA: hypothetical protein VGA37_11810 [Gemmatimonadales bacterium]